ncbi:response regulator of citrate/malate metabolism [Kibdelosporangium banguiense]|uniref:Transcriptional regulatory protein n=1 Tax=Kibdelosporangium banguiense TaxID=1365924 RepID=A0ABS4TJM1_9PSEU|nr:response regulator [Kibdelosporangium banguiense]MBP2324618.1 response regulator of citrate/malate metabolism [Kibdelosporangium banguiense]
MIRVLVVEDDPVAADAHKLYVQRVAGFEVSGVAHTGAEAMRFVEQHPIDLLLLDLYLPDAHGLQICRALRAANHSIDVIAVTSARDLQMVKAAVSAGVVQYLLKPFTFATLRDKLERYALFRDTVTGEAAGQEEVDRALATLRGTDGIGLPKGMSADTLDSVIAALRETPDGLSAVGAASAVGISRVTARRYLEHLADTGTAVRRPQYGQVGRPELFYKLAAN